MLQGLNIQNLAAKIAANQELKRDFVADTRKTRLSWRAPEANETGVVELELEDHGSFLVRPLAHDQIGAYTGVPSKYYDRMLAEEPVLLARNVNTWLEKQAEPRMVRTLAGDARAFLSNRYNRIENEEIAAVAFPVLARLPDVRIVSSEVTERRLYIQFVVPGVEGEVKRGDVVQAGGVISNSEVGCGSVSVCGLIWRLACLNGMKTQDALRRYHVGREVEEGALGWADDTRRADDRAVLLKVRDMVSAVVDQTRFQANLAKMRQLTMVEAKDPVKAVEVLSAKVGATEAEKNGILSALIKGADLSAWGLLNAVTAQAHTAGSYDRAVEFEGMGGQLLELGRSEWREVLEAA